MISSVNKAIDQYNSAIKVLNKDIRQTTEKQVSYRNKDGERRTRTVRSSKLLYGGLNLSSIGKVEPLDVEAPQASLLGGSTNNNIDLGGMNINIEKFNSDDPADKASLFTEIENWLAQKLQTMVKF